MQRFYEKYFGWLIAPALVLFVWVVVLPFAMGILYSFTAWRGSYFHGGKRLWESFVGLENYREALRSPDFAQAFVNTLEYTAMTVGTVVLLSLGLALLTMQVKRGAGVYRAALFLPNLLGGLALGYIWSFVFEIVWTEFVFAQDFLDIALLRNMLQHRHKALAAMALVSAWQMTGYMMMIFVAGLHAIPGELYEAAAIDGCTAWGRLFHVTLPMLASQVTMVVFLSLANCFKMLDINVALTEGAFDTRLLAFQILRVPRDASPPDYGLAQAQAVLFFVMIASVTLYQVLRRREVRR